MKPARLSRRALLQAGGGLVVALQLPVFAAQAAATRGAVAGPPDAKQIDSWLAIHADDTATLYLGFAELGQGATTALLQVAAEELDLDLDQIRAAPLDTHTSVNQGGTYSSASVARGRPQIAAAAATARAACSRSRQTDWVQRSTRSVSREAASRCSGGSRTVGYGELVGGRTFDLAVAADAKLKSTEQYRYVGKPSHARTFARELTAPSATCSNRRCPACSMAASSGLAGRARTAAARGHSKWTTRRSRPSPARACCARATSSAWSRRANGMPSGPHPLCVSGGTTRRR